MLKSSRNTDISLPFWLTWYPTITVSQGVFVASREREGSAVWCGCVAPVQFELFLWRGFFPYSWLVVVVEESRKYIVRRKRVQASTIFRDHTDTKDRADVSLVLHVFFTFVAVFCEEERPRYIRGTWTERRWEREERRRRRRKKQKMSKTCARCEKTVYPIEELKCLDKVLLHIHIYPTKFSNSPLSLDSSSFVNDLIERFRRRINISQKILFHLISIPLNLKVSKYRPTVDWTDWFYFISLKFRREKISRLCTIVRFHSWKVKHRKSHVSISNIIPFKFDALIYRYRAKCLINIQCIHIR